MIWGRDTTIEGRDHQTAGLSSARGQKTGRDRQVAGIITGILG